MFENIDWVKTLALAGSIITPALAILKIIAKHTATPVDDEIVETVEEIVVEVKAVKK